MGVGGCSSRTSSEGWCLSGPDTGESTREGRESRDVGEPRVDTTPPRNVPPAPSNDTRAREGDRQVDLDTSRDTSSTDGTRERRVETRGGHSTGTETVTMDGSIRRSNRSNSSSGRLAARPLCPSAGLPMRPGGSTGSPSRRSWLEWEAADSPPYRSKGS